jgi:hypothetical protein
MRVRACEADFSELWKVARDLAGSSRRYVEVLPGYVCFHFASQIAHLKFCLYVLKKRPELVVIHKDSDAQPSNDL